MRPRKHPSSALRTPVVFEVRIPEGWRPSTDAWTAFLRTVPGPTQVVLRMRVTGARLLLVVSAAPARPGEHSAITDDADESAGRIRACGIDVVRVDEKELDRLTDVGALAERAGHVVADGRLAGTLLIRPLPVRLPSTWLMPLADVTSDLDLSLHLRPCQVLGVVEAGMALTVWADNMPELGAVTRHIQRLVASPLIATAGTTFRSAPAFFSTRPLGVDRTGAAMRLPATTPAAIVNLASALRRRGGAPQGEIA